MEKGKDSLKVLEYSPLRSPFWDSLKTCKHVLLAGCGGGYDIFSGIPLFFALKKMGIKASLANLSFTLGLENVSGERFTKHCVAVTDSSSRCIHNKDGELVPNPDYDLSRDMYFPELFLSKWMKEEEGLDVPVYTFPRLGVIPTVAIYEELIERLDIDAVVLVDGGTDSLMRGDETNLGTPIEDMTSICSLNKVLYCDEGKGKGIKGFLVCIGFGVDAFHGVNHARFLENVADLVQKKGYFGAQSILPYHEEAMKFISAYEACQPANSIVCSSVSSALIGKFGNYQHPATHHRTSTSKLFINPLMSIYFYFDLQKVADNVYYLSELEDTVISTEIRSKINKWRNQNVYNPKGKFKIRKDKIFPH